MLLGLGAWSVMNQVSDARIFSTNSQTPSAPEIRAPQSPPDVAPGTGFYDGLRRQTRSAQS